MMIRSYLGYVEIIEMISKRLSKTQKEEILEAYKAGDNTNVLAEKYSCTSNTINRTVKTLLPENEYKLIKEKRSKMSNKNVRLIDSEKVKEKKEDFVKTNSINSVKEKDQSIKLNEGFDSKEIKKIDSLASDYNDDLGKDFNSQIQKNKNQDLDENNQKSDNIFEEIAPLLSNFDFDLEKQKSDFEILNYKSLPESVYMIVDKKVELEPQPISDLTEWSFLPENELQRNAIILFANQRSAKRTCSRNQRVIKIPNTSIFKLSKPYLISKGITRLIIEDLIIGLDD